MSSCCVSAQNKNAITRGVWRGSSERTVMITGIESSITFWFLLAGYIVWGSVIDAHEKTKQKNSTLHLHSWHLPWIPN